MGRVLACFIAASAALGTAGVMAQAPAAPYHLAASIPLSDGGWDLLTFDGAHNRVLVARGGAVSVADLATGQAHDVGQIAGGHGVVVVPGSDEIAVTSGRDNTLRLLDGRDGHELAKIPVGDGPDAAIWDAQAKRIVVMNAEGGSVSLVDPAARKVVRTIPVKKTLELAAVISPGMLAVNDEDAGELELVDMRQGKALAPLPLKGCESPTGLAYDAADHLSLSACRNGVAALMDTSARRVIKLLPIGQGPDGALFDAKRRRFLVPCGRSGTLSVFAVSGKQVTPAGTVTTEVGARTAALDPATGRVFLPSAKFQPAQAGQRPAMVPGSAHLLIVEPS